MYFLKKLFLLALACGPLAAGAQRFTGRVLDSLTRQPVEYATVQINPQHGAVTNARGNFTLEAPAGAHTLTVGCIGYATRTLEVKAGSLGDILLAKKAVDLQAVTITAPRDLVQNKMDKLVYNAEKDVTTLGGVATDILKKVPMVSVDVDGNVQLMGNGNILFLINGQPSSIFGNNLADALQSIPASQIKSIEVITSPGAKYDAEGTAGIINIILKDNKINGVNGNVSLTGGSRLQNGSFNLNGKHGNLGVNAFFSGNAQLPSETRTTSTRDAFDSLGHLVGALTQQGSSRFLRNGFESGLGAEWTISKRDNLSGSLGFDDFGNSNHGSTNQFQTGYVPAASLVLADNHFRATSLDWDLRYKRTFAREDQELDVSMDGSEGWNTSAYATTQSLPAGDSTFAGSSGTSTGRDHETNLRVDYTQPLGGKVKLETGGRIQVRNITSNSPVYDLGNVFDSTQSSALDYKRRVYAGYASLSFPLGKFLDARAGLRYERTETDAVFSGAPGTHIPGYNTFAPSVLLAHDFPHDQQLKFGYTHRIQRPDYRSLNPYVNATDPKNLVRGNPFLQPEIGNNFELTYSKSFQEGSVLNVAAFYRRNTHDIQPYIQYYDQFTLGDTTYTGVSVSTPMNVGSETNIGLNIYGSVPVTKKLDLRTNISLFHRYIVAGALDAPSITSINYRINLNATYQLAPTFVLEFFGNFNSSRNEIQGRYPSFTTYNLAARKQFFHKKASLAFTTTNPFNPYVNQKTELSGSGFTLTSLRQVPFRSFGLNFTYKFGHLEFKKDKDTSPDMPSAPED